MRKNTITVNSTSRMTSSLKSIAAMLLVSVFFLCSCGSEKKSDNNDEQTEKTENTTRIPTPSFNPDSAYAFVKKQVDFGPRIPGTKAHAECALWLEQKLKSYFPEVVVQKGTATTFDQKKFEIKNIVGSYNPQNSKRILLCAHWDTRPFADRDQGGNLNKVFDGANDGGSGVGALLEIARQISIAKPDMGVDIIFFDLEDYGRPDDSPYPEMQDSWCLGSQYWARNPHKSGYFAQYGILLDMVGAKGAVFPKEGASMVYAPTIVDKVWKTAERLGYGAHFINLQSNPITDDHIYVNQIANIPCINIIHYDVNESDFFSHHHRVSDNMDQIDPATLKMVGQTVLEVLFNP